MKLNIKFLAKYLYWKLIYRRILENKIINLNKPKFKNPDLPILLSQWRSLRYTFDGAIYDKKGYFVKFKK